MKTDYLIVHKKLLPAKLEKVVEARQLLDSGEAASISDAAKKVGISRNTYYKYKDYVYTLPGESRRHAVITMVLKDAPGTLSCVINAITSRGCNIVTISQAVPLNGYATILITLDISDLQGSSEDLLKLLSGLDATCSVELSAIE